MAEYIPPQISLICQLSEDNDLNGAMLNHIATQEFNDYEVILIGINDYNFAFADAIKDPKIAYIYNDQLSQLADAINICNGKYVIFIDNGILLNKTSLINLWRANFNQNYDICMAQIAFNDNFLRIPMGHNEKSYLPAWFAIQAYQHLVMIRHASLNKILQYQDFKNATNFWGLIMANWQYFCAMNFGLTNDIFAEKANFDGENQIANWQLWLDKFDNKQYFTADIAQTHLNLNNAQFWQSKKDLTKLIKWFEALTTLNHHESQFDKDILHEIMVNILCFHCKRHGINQFTINGQVHNF